MFKVITTQFRENYGAHDWSGEGACPQHWKNKGGTTYILCGEMTEADIAEISNCIEFSDEYASESILSISATSSPADFYEEWETPVNVTKVAGEFRAVSKHKNVLRGHTLLACGETSNYTEMVL
jgi:hypothetical protein|tara:strand:+ start:2342 stop:2713 length:372 start_codon:yes stop_codon:yes gene_type:complete